MTVANYRENAHVFTPQNKPQVGQQTGRISNGIVFLSSSDNNMNKQLERKTKCTAANWHSHCTTQYFRTEKTEKLTNNCNEKISKLTIN